MRKITGCIMCVLMIVVSGYALGSYSERVVNARGEGETYDEALKRAMRAAVEKGVGVLVDSETIIKNNQLISDKVYTEVKGYINSYAWLRPAEYS